MAIVDLITYNGEKDLWDIHYNVLKDYVDEFIVVEFDKTFSGNDKSFSFGPEIYPKVKYVKHGWDDYVKYRDMALASPNTQGAVHWKLEFMQKESIKDALSHLKDDDTVFIGDVDEIWDPSVLKDLNVPLDIGRFQKRKKLKLRVYTYWIDNRSSEEFWGTLMSPYGDIKSYCLNHLRSDKQYLTEKEYGWHFTSMGGEDALKKKLTDSYTQESYATPYVLEHLGDNMAKNKDFLGRDFTYRIDESEWPQYLKDNKEKYAHLCKTTILY